MAAGDLARPTRRQRRQIDEAVRAAEARTGLQLCVVLGAPGTEDARAAAEALFVDAGLTTRPAVLVLVDPKRHQVEVVTGPDARARVSDEVAGAAVARMTAQFARRRLVAGLVEGIEALADAAGPGTAPPDTPDLPNVLG